MKIELSKQMQHIQEKQKSVMFEVAKHNLEKKNVQKLYITKGLWYMCKSLHNNVEKCVLSS